MTKPTEQKTNKLDRFRGCLLGLSVGDAVGTTVEFRSRGTFPPVTDMTGGGPFHLQPGEWTDDTSMALCLAASLIEKHGFNPDDQMKRYCAWQDHGYMSSNGRCFDIGNTVAEALNSYRRTANPFSGSTDPRRAGNGSIMRLAPIPMFYYPSYSKTIRYSAQSSRTTHSARQCLDACRLFGSILHKALSGRSKEAILSADDNLNNLSPMIERINRHTYKQKEEQEIRGSGYVVESLEAALWCFHQTDNYRDAILKAANLGDDADTTAAVCGQIAGAHYGMNGIPSSWLNQLVMKEEIQTFADQLLSIAKQTSSDELKS